MSMQRRGVDPQRMKIHDKTEIGYFQQKAQAKFG